MKAVDLDTDGSIKRQGLHRHFAIDRVSLIDLRKNLQFYADRYGLQECARRIEPYANGAPGFFLLGSGDFHHLTLLILEKISAPFVLVIFDNHTDCSFLSPKYHCGNWMYHAALLPGCEKVIHVGSTEGHDILSRHMGITALKKKGRLSMLPGMECAGDCADRFKKLVDENNPKGLPVYVSIDKDVLKGDESPGDWENGVMTMSSLSRMIEFIKESFSIAGADVTGEKGGKFHYSYRPVKNLLSYIEHPANSGKDMLLDMDSKQKIINIEILEIFGVEHVAC